MLAGVLFERAVFFSSPAKWMALRRDVNKTDVREAVQAFLRRARRALDAREAGDPDFTILVPDQGEGSADEAARALLDDARRAISERRHEELRRSLDSVRELVMYAMDEIKTTDIQWSAPGSQPEWPPLRELNRNLYSFREDVIREGDREYILELLRFDYLLAAEGVRERCGELFTVGLDGHRWNYQIANRFGGEFREMLRDRFSLNAEGLILGAEVVDIFPYARELVRQQERLLSDAMHSNLPNDYSQLHREFEVRLQAIRLHWEVDNWPPSEASADIPHIRLRVSKEPAILHDGDGRGIPERRQLSHRAHKTISRCRELASARQRRQLSARLHTLQLIQAHSPPLATLVTSDDPKDTRYPGAGWSPPIRSSTCRNTSRGTATSAS